MPAAPVSTSAAAAAVTGMRDPGSGTRRFFGIWGLGFGIWDLTASAPLAVARLSATAINCVARRPNDGTSEESVPRVFDEINEFEAQQRDYGTLLVKLYFDVSADVQGQRLAQRRMNRWRTKGGEDECIRADDPAYQRALEELRANTETRWSPWRTIDGDDEQQAALAALEAIAEAWSKAMPAEPPQLLAAPRVAQSG